MNKADQIVYGKAARGKSFASQADFDRHALQFGQQPMANVTKDGIEVKVGQIWKDLDYRMTGRQCRVMAVEDGKVKMQQCVLGTLGKKSTVSVKRMHKHSTGWELVSE